MESVKEPTLETTDKRMLQRLMDNPWILLILGFLIPTISYTIWGWVELLRVPVAPLP